MLPTARLPRTWWFPSLRGYRSTAPGTYVPHPLDEQPAVDLADDELSWLEQAAEGDPVQPTPPLTEADLAVVAPELPLPASLRRFVARPALQRRVHSVTACYFDLGDFVVPTSPGDGHLLHVLSDQQWTLHWLLHLDADGNEAVLVSGEPIGFALGDDWGVPPPAVIPLDGTYDVAVCADSFAEFLYRFWIENELWLALQDDRTLAPHLAAYAARLPPAS